MLGKVVLQTHFPDHYAVQFAARHDYHGFAEKELRFRRLDALSALRRAGQHRGAQ